MRSHRLLAFGVAAAATILLSWPGIPVRAADPVAAAGSSSPGLPGAPAERFFLGFAEEAALAKAQWWEGRLAFTSGDPVDVFAAEFVIAMQPWKNLEFGGRGGFGSSDAPAGSPDGTGATDLDVWGKYHFGTFGEDTELAAGALFTVPTGDDTAALGRDAFDLEAFGSLRHRTSRTIIGVQLGFRLNGDGSVGGQPYSGSNSAFLGAGAIVPMSDVVRLVGEVRMESAREDGGDSDFRILGGIDWKPFSRGVLRGSITVGFTDAAPDAKGTIGYAITF